jgi:hypothetical protein
VQRVKDPEEFRRELERPLVSEAGQVGLVVTDAELEQDAQAFMAFASAFGVTPPTSKSQTETPDALPSATSASQRG